MSEITYSYAKKVFSNILQTARIIPGLKEENLTEGIVKSINEFMGLVVEANSMYNDLYQIPEDKRLIISEDMPAELLSVLNNNSADTTIYENTLNDIRIVTYLANEEPGTISARKINEDGIKNIKWRFAGVFDDPEYTGYQIIRYIKDVEAYITFKVWGKYFEDIVWLGSFEEELWDSKNIAKFKTQKYMIRYAEVKELREKTIEQVVINYGLN